ncbi:MAG: DNA-processing protein DprA [Acidobacteriota bacterium]
MTDRTDDAYDRTGAGDGAAEGRRPLASGDQAGFVALSLLPIHRWRDAAERLKAGETAAVALDHVLAMRPPILPDTAPALLANAAAALARGAACGLAPIVWSDAAYPPALAAIADPPPVLWTRGSRAALERPAVAIVGSRAASPYAIEVAERLAADLAACGLTIVSGLARGVDAAAHRGALSAGGATVAVLGCGADIVYPREHAGLARAIEPDGLIISELIPGTPPRPQFFPQRNRIISGLSRAVVIVEAGERSGSLITARCALEQGRDVLAVPGNVLSGRNRGGHALLKDGARIVESADDVLEEIVGLAAPAARPVAAASADPVLACLTPGEACDLDGIAERSGLSPARLLPRLFELELRGLIRRAGGGRFVRLDRSC